MYKIIDPTLDLFLYDLGYGLGEDENQQKNNYNYFLAKMPKKCRLSHEKTLNKNNQNIESEFIELLKTKNDNDKETRYLFTINIMKDLMDFTIQCVYWAILTDY